MNLDYQVDILVESDGLLPNNILLFGEATYYNFNANSKQPSITLGYGKLFIEFGEQIKTSFSHLGKKIWEGNTTTKYDSLPSQQTDFLKKSYKFALDQLVYSFVRQDDTWLPLEFKSEEGLCAFCEEKNDFSHEFSPALYSFLDFYGRLLSSNENFSQFETFQEFLFSLNMHISGKKDLSKKVQNIHRATKVSEEFYRRLLARAN